MMDSIPKKLPDVSLEGVQLQSMLSGGREVVLGMVHDPTFGLMLMFGLGGIYVEFSKISGLREPLLTKEKLER